MKVDAEHYSKDPPPTEALIVRISEFFTYKIYGTAADPPLKGGDGGAGGIGGFPGDIRIVNLNQQHQIKFEQNEGNF